MVKKREVCDTSIMRFLKKIRDSKGLSIGKFAQDLGIFPQTYHNFETKAQGMSFKNLVNLKRKLNLSWDDLGKMLEEEVDYNSKKKGKE